MRRFRVQFVAAVSAITLVLGVTGAQAVGPQATDAPHSTGSTYDFYDSRAQLTPAGAPNVIQRAAVRALRPATVEWDDLYGIPKLIIEYGGYLTRPSDAAPQSIARSFLGNHGDLFGLGATDLSQLVMETNAVSKHNGATHLSFGQRDQGRTVYGAVLQFTVDENGRIVIAGGRFHPGAIAAGAPLLTAAQAVGKVAALAGAPSDTPLTVKSAGTGPARLTRFDNSVAQGLGNPTDITAELVTFPMPVGHPHKLGWKTVIEIGAEQWYEAVVDAMTGDLLYRTNYYSHSGPQGTVFTGEHPDNSPPRSVQALSGLDGSWVTDTRTEGNNVIAYQDLDNSNTIGYQPTTPGAGDPNYQHFDYPFSDLWNTNSNGIINDSSADFDSVITQLFFYTNMMHDYTYGLGFTEPFRNFQEDNFGRGGLGGDPVNAEAQNGINNGCKDDDDNPIPCLNNAFFGTPADGNNPRMQMYMWTTPHRDGSLDADVIAHEYGHGVSSRLVGSGTLGGGEQTGSMGEGWSDTLSMYLWGDSVVGDFVTGNANGVRSVNYASSPHVYSDFSYVVGGCEVHCNGEIWATVLYDLQEAFIDEYGSATGQAEVDQLLLDGMKNTITSPTFLNARDGILAADVLTNSGENQCMIWKVFADREMGLSASSPSQTVVTGATDGPAACIPTANANGPYATAEGTPVSLDGTASTESAHSSGGALSYAWNFDGDPDFDDATDAAPSFGLVGQDGLFPVGLRVTNDAGWSNDAASTVTISNVAPSVSLGTNAPKNEGSLVSVSGSITDPGWLDPLTATINWGDGTIDPISGVLTNSSPEAELTFDATHTYGDNTTYPVEVCANDDDTQTCQSIDVLINNVAPDLTLDPAQIDAIEEGDVLNAVASFTDPGWLDTYTYTIDWGTGASDAGVPVIDVEGPPQDEGHIDSSNQYGDNGSFPIEITVSDDDTGTDDVSFTLEVDNIDPTAVIDKSGATLVNGSPTFIADVLIPVPYGAESDDPGSDDLTFAWNWDDGAPAPDELFTSRVAPPADDPLPSPDVNPRIDVTDARAHAFAKACLYIVGLEVGDDDAGSANDEIATVITAAAGGKKQPSSFWQSETKRGGKVHSAETLNCYLKITGYMSRVFNEERNAATIPAAHDVTDVSGAGGSSSDKLDRELITAWLNFANGTIEYGQLVDTNGDKLPDTSFANAMTAAEDVRLNPAATNAQLDQQRDIVHQINVS
jgi:hypothetical protein